MDEDNRADNVLNRMAAKTVDVEALEWQKTNGKLKGSRPPLSDLT